jgi:hypothetical protein
MLYVRVDFLGMAATPPPWDLSQLFDFVGSGSSGVVFFSREFINQVVHVGKKVCAMAF